jgi:hypothetical protein
MEEKVWVATLGSQKEKVVITLIEEVDLGTWIEVKIVGTRESMDLVEAKGMIEGGVGLASGIKVGVLDLETKAIATPEKDRVLRHCNGFF